MSAKLIAEEGPFKGRILPLDQGTEWLIGRDPECDLVLEDSKASRKHVLCRLVDRDFVLENLSDINPVLVNEKPFEGNYPLKEGDRVRIGSTLFYFTLLDKPIEKPKKDALEDQYDDIFEDAEDVPPPIEEEIPKDEIEKVEEHVEDEFVHRDEVHRDEQVEEPPKDQEEIDIHYDTIFQEGDDLDEAIAEGLSDDYLERSRWHLKVLAGPNTGAEFGMVKEKTYIIGKDVGSCDILFHDLSVSRNHAKLSIKEDETLLIEDLNSRNGVLVDGELIKDQMQIATNNLVTLGTTTFVVVDREKGAETLVSLSLPSAPKEKEEETVEEEKYQEPEYEEEEEDLAKAHGVSSSSFIVTGLLVAVILILGIGIVMLFSSKEVRPKEGDYSESIKEAIKTYPDVLYSYNKNTRNLFLYGHVLTTVDKEQFLYQLDGMKSIKKIEDNIVVDEQVWREMNQILDRYPQWRGVSIHASEPGNFVITGYLQTRQQMGLLTDYVHTHFPYTDRLSNHVIVEEDLFQEVFTKIRGAGFYNVQIGLVNGDLSLSGYVAINQRESFLELIKTLRSIPGVSRLNNFVMVIEDKGDLGAIDISSQYKITGYGQHDNVNMSVVVNGRILTVGSYLDNMNVISIQPHTVYLEKNGLKYKINYNR